MNIDKCYCYDVKFSDIKAISEKIKSKALSDVLQNTNCGKKLPALYSIYKRNVENWQNFL